MIRLHLYSGCNKSGTSKGTNIMENRKRQKSVAELYLAKMKLEYRDIRTYTNILEALRKYEI